MLTRPARIALLVAASTTAAADDPSSIDLGPFAVDVVRGKANVTILGDSISNFSQSDWMYTGLLLEWRPHRWRQIHTSPLASGPAIGSWANLTASADYTIVHPGQVRPGLERMVGACPWSVQVIRGDGWSGRGISAGFHRMAFQYEGGLMPTEPPVFFAPADSSDIASSSSRMPRPRHGPPGTSAAGTRPRAPPPNLRIRTSPSPRATRRR
jgi:hypothetical protein